MNNKREFKVGEQIFTDLTQAVWEALALGKPVFRELCISDAMLLPELDPSARYEISKMIDQELGGKGEAAEQLKEFLSKWASKFYPAYQPVCVRHLDAEQARDVALLTIGKQLPELKEFCNMATRENSEVCYKYLVKLAQFLSENKRLRKDLETLKLQVVPVAKRASNKSLKKPSSYRKK